MVVARIQVKNPSKIFMMHSFLTLYQHLHCASIRILAFFESKKKRKGWDRRRNVEQKKFAVAVYTKQHHLYWYRWSQKSKWIINFKRIIKYQWKFSEKNYPYLKKTDEFRLLTNSLMIRFLNCRGHINGRIYTSNRTHRK